MDGNKRNFFKKHPSIQFKKKGGNKNGKWNNSSREQSSGESHSVDTVYRILCPAIKIGCVIGKGGSIVKALREETRARITVADPVPGSEDRVIIIYSSPDRIYSKQNDDEDSIAEDETEPMEPHCAAQDALLKVHYRIIEEELVDGMKSGDDNDSNVVTARLLVPNQMVGCLLGKGGDVIQRLRNETGANIRILPADHLPACATSTDELVQIAGKQDVAKRALYEVSTLLHQKARKVKSPLAFPLPVGGQGFHPPGGSRPSMLPPENPMWSHQNSSSHGLPPRPWMEGYGNPHSESVPRGFDGVPPPGPGSEGSAEFSMKILCSAERIGWVIGKGGFNLKQLEHETGATINVPDVSVKSDERVIYVSAIEDLWNPRSQTIEAILLLQNKASEYSERGNIITRLLVPASKVGCILGQGGHVINEMRWRTQADIRVYSKDDKPKCAAENEELVQISGNFGVAKDALAEIASRLRVRTLQNAGAEIAPVRSAQKFGWGGSIPGGGLPPSGTMGAGSSDRYDPLEVDGHEYEPQSHPVLPAATGYSNVNSALDVKIPNSAIHSVIGSGRSSISHVGEIGGARVKLRDFQVGGTEGVVAIHGSSEHSNAALSNLQSVMGSAGLNINSQQNSYQNMNALHGSHQNLNAQQIYQGSYPNMNAQQSPYHLSSRQGSYSNINVPHGGYHNITAQQGYQY
ncbi:KH domain-containing protein HEN4-like isoform X2 [Carya illinoinensis]|nr:KH domain-containing protein HEN4-like isoform X2 [Carya illinoinensis]